NRGKAAVKMLPFIRRRVGLTGTPASNGLLDLFGQYLVVDGGIRLGSSFDAYQKGYFIQTDKAGYRFKPGFGAPEAIANIIGDITVSMSAEDYLDMPDLITNDIMLELPPNLQEAYDEIERQMMVELQSGHTIEVFNQASLINRTLQYANGAIYKEPGQPEWEQIHDVKLDALEDIMEESAGEPLLVAFEFQHDAHKILKRFPDAVWFSSKLSEEKATKAIEDFRTGRLRMLIGHPGSMGHGLDRLQQAGHIIVWYGMNWSLDLYDQTIARLWRQGQERPVMVHRLVMDNTTDLVVRESLARKASDETSIKTAIEQYWSRKQ
ncbi:MAG: ATP-dependent helicase, partial [Gammaproteobacteria bacterium]